MLHFVGLCVLFINKHITSRGKFGKLQIWLRIFPLSFLYLFLLSFFLFVCLLFDPCFFLSFTSYFLFYGFHFRYFHIFLPFSLGFLLSFHFHFLPSLLFSFLPYCLPLCVCLFLISLRSLIPLYIVTFSKLPAETNG